MLKSLRTLCACGLLLVSVVPAVAQDLDPDQDKAVTISASVRGVPVNGWNRIFGDAAIDDLRFVGNLQFAVGGVFNTEGPALPIDNDTPADALLASYAAPDVYLAFFGIAGAENSPNQNIVLDEYPQIFKHDGTEGPLTPLLENDEWWDYSNGAQIKGYTVADWLAARGRVTFTCSPEEGNYYGVRLRNMVPGGLYTVWGFYFDTETGMLQQDFPFGGTSANVFVANRKGNINGERSLNFCPLTVGDEERYQLVNLFMVFHPDGRVNAAVGHTVAMPPFNGPGMTATPQVMFPMPDEF